MEKEHKYAMQIMSAIQSCFEDDSEHKISLTELQEGNNLTNFFHALANIAPAMIYDHITGSDTNTLEFNHIANRLCFQYSTLVKEKEEEGG